MPPPCQCRCLIGDRVRWRSFEKPQPRCTLIRLAALGTLCRIAGEGGPSPARGWVGEGLEPGEKLIAFVGRERLPTFQARAADDQFD